MSMTPPTIDSFEFWQLVVGAAFALYVVFHVALTLVSVFGAKRRT